MLRAIPRGLSGKVSFYILALFRKARTTLGFALDS